MLLLAIKLMSICMLTIRPSLPQWQHNFYPNEMTSKSEGLIGHILIYHCWLTVTTALKAAQKDRHMYGWTASMQ